MGWGDCGKDSQGRPIGYYFEATCDHPECNVEIDRGLAYACGGMHGEGAFYCENYFCEAHRTFAKLPPDGDSGDALVSRDGYIEVCLSCEKQIKRYKIEEEIEDDE